MCKNITCLDDDCVPSLLCSAGCAVTPQQIFVEGESRRYPYLHTVTLISVYLSVSVPIKNSYYTGRGNMQDAIQRLGCKPTFQSSLVKWHSAGYLTYLRISAIICQVKVGTEHLSHRVAGRITQDNALTVHIEYFLISHISNGGGSCRQLL